MEKKFENPFSLFILKEVKIETKKALLSGKTTFGGINNITGKLIRVYDKFIMIETKDKIISINIDNLIYMEMEKNKK